MDAWSVFDWSSYGTAIKTWIQHRNRRSRVWTVERIASRINTTSEPVQRAHLQNFLDYRRNLAAGSLDRLISDVLQLSEESKDYFRNLVTVVWGSPEDRLAALRRILDRHTKTVEAARISADWYHFVVFEMSTYPGFKDDPDYVAARVVPRITREQAAASLNLLKELQLLHLTNEGNVIQVNRALKVTEDQALERAALMLLIEQLQEKALYASFRSPSQQVVGEALVKAIPTSCLPEVLKLVSHTTEQVLAIIGAAQAKAPSSSDSVRAHVDGGIETILGPTGDQQVYGLIYTLFPLALASDQRPTDSTQTDPEEERER